MNLIRCECFTDDNKSSTERRENNERESLEKGDNQLQFKMLNGQNFIFVIINYTSYEDIFFIESIHFTNHVNSSRFH